MPRKIIATTIALFAILICDNFVFAEDNFAAKLAGKILLQVEKNGEAWYVNPANYKKYFLNRPRDAFELMRNIGIGITNSNLTKIPIGNLNISDTLSDIDQDGLSNNLENAIGTNPEKNDTDEDGYDDLTEIANNYDPLSNKKINIDLDFTKNNLGKIFIQIENNGEAWYIDPISEKRYFLSAPKDAFLSMQKFGLGISNDNISKIITGVIEADEPKNPPKIEDPPCQDCNSPENNNADSAMSGAASAIRANNSEAATKYFIPEMQKAIEYTLDFLNSEGRLTLGNILSGAKLTASTENKKTYSTEVYFSMGGYKVPVSFYVEKQEDGKWLLVNL